MESENVICFLIIKNELDNLQLHGEIESGYCRRYHEISCAFRTFLTKGMCVWINCQEIF